MVVDQYKEDIPLLVEGGLIAIKQGDEESAKRLFQAVSILDPESQAPTMGLGLIALHKMKTIEARKHFQKILDVEPTNYRAQAFLSFGYILGAFNEEESKNRLENLHKAAEHADEVVANADAEDTKQLAQSVIDWLYELQTTSKQGPA